MKKRLIVTVALVLIASMALTAPSVAKQKPRTKPLIVTEHAAAGLPDHPNTWYATVTGDINGTQEAWGMSLGTLPGDPVTPGIVDPIIMGGAAPGYTILVTDTGTITYYTLGIYIQGVWEERNCGFVTNATGEWAYLLGWMTYGYGFTSDPSTWEFPYWFTGYRVFLPALPAKWGKLGM
jgi:hypothetical protein